MPEEFTRAHGYFVSQLTDHITETPEGFLVVVGCPVARTGWQDYAVRDLPQESAKQLGVDTSNPSATIGLYRPASEVFHPEFLASLNGKPIVDNHPPDFVTPENFSQYSMGHVQNPRRGAQMEDGEWPVIADLVISSEPLVSKVKTKQARDISLGYDYGIEREGERINQCMMVANHAAVVPKGRAGDLISIGDEAPPADQRAATSQTSTAAPTKKERKPVANILKHLRGLALKAYAVDAEPEEIAEAAEVLNQAPPEAKDNDDPEEGPTEVTETQDRRNKMHDALDELLDEPGAMDRRKGWAKDADINALKAAVAKAEQVYKAAKTAQRKAMAEYQAVYAKPKHTDAEWKHVSALTAEAEKTADVAATALAKARYEVQMAERAARMAKDGWAKDADIEALKDLLQDFFNEEEEEPQHAATDLEEEIPEEQTIDADPSELEELMGAGEEPDAEDEEVCACGDPECEGCDATEELEPSGEEALVDDRAKAADAAMGAKAVLKMLRPFVARAKDARLADAFNTALRTTTRTSRPSTGSYGAFATASRDRSRAPQQNFARATDAASDANAKVQAAYDAIRTGSAKGGK